ncbi:MAG TPA: YHS domain-containing protein, partial [Pyrinomonadaceae bacterium]|nr:YHS domain-containing protein [Pyrinomonadaceae bacterium]
METKNLQIDPVCNMKVSPETASAKYEYNGTTYYFCNVRCKERFAAEPERYLAKDGKDGSASTPATVHSIGRELPVVHHGEMAATPQGEFIDPVCGMRVSPENAAGEYEHNGEKYYFCSKGCLSKFNADPEKFLSAASSGSSDKSPIPDPRSQ